MGLIEALHTIKKYCANTFCSRCEMSVVCDDVFGDCPSNIKIKDLKEIEIEE